MFGSTAAGLVFASLIATSGFLVAGAGTAGGRIESERSKLSPATFLQLATILRVVLLQSSSTNLDSNERQSILLDRHIHSP